MTGARVAVVGHRILSDVARVRDGIHLALDRIAAAFPGRPLVMLSALAEGADRLAAEEAVRRGWRLVAPLPMPREVYLRDFTTPASLQEFARLLGQAAEVIELPPARDRSSAFEGLAAWLLDRAEAVLAVWDGTPPQGRGGTGAAVAAARARGLPLAWVRAGNRDPLTNAPRSLGAEQGTVAFERLPG